MKIVKKVILVALMTTILLSGCSRNNVNSETADMTTIQLADKDSIETEEDDAIDPSDEAKLKLIFTIDTEDAYGNVPNKIECDFGDAGACGVDYIMDTFERYDMRAVFFVNIYEHLRYSGEYDKYIENLVKEIDERGHEVGLHAHADNTLGFYDKSLSQCSYEEQERILKYGKDFIQEILGKAPISFRGGAYGVNDDTFKILENEGFIYDSSYFYGIEGNKFDTYNSLNNICKVDQNLIEFPVIRVIRSDGVLTKLDINTLSYEELTAVIEEMKEREGFEYAQLMFHSFSFIDQVGDGGGEYYFAEGSHIAYGIDDETQIKFEKFLEYISNDESVEVITFEQLNENELVLPTEESDGIFVCNSAEASETAEKFKFERNRIGRFDISFDENGRTVTFIDSYINEDAEFAWYVYYGSESEPIDKIMYDKSNSLSYKFENEGEYQIKLFIRTGSDKTSKFIADITVEGENAKCTLR